MGLFNGIQPGYYFYGALCLGAALGAGLAKGILWSAKRIEKYQEMQPQHSAKRTAAKITKCALMTFALLLSMFSVVTLGVGSAGSIVSTILSVYNKIFIVLPINIVGLMVTPSAAIIAQDVYNEIGARINGYFKRTTFPTLSIFKTEQT